MAEGGVGRASALLAAGTMISRVLGFGKAIVLAMAIGQVGSSAGNAFGIANQLPNNIYALIAGGLLSAVLVPQIVRAGKDADGGSAFINRILTLGVSVFLVAGVAATLAAPLLITLYGRALEGPTYALAVVFAYWCLPQVLFYAIYSLLGEVLNARRVYGPFTWAPVVNNVVAITGLGVFMLLYGGAAQNSDASGWDAGQITLLAGTTTLGVAAQAGFLAFFWRRAGLRYRPDFRWRGVGLGRTGKAAGWMFAMVVVGQIAAVFQSNASAIAADTPGVAGVVALQNSWLVFMLPHSIVAVSLITVYYTRMSGHVHAGDDAALRADIAQSLRTILLVIVFASVGLMVLAFPFARFFEGSFPKVEAMAHVVLAYLPALAAFSTLAVMQRVLYAREETRTAFWLQLVQSLLVIISASLCSLLLPVQNLAVGIAIGTSIAGTVQAVLAVLIVRRRIGGIHGHKVLARVIVYTIASLLAGGVGLAVLHPLGGFRADGWAQSGIGPAALAMALVGGLMAAVYGTLLLLARDPEIRGLVGMVRRRLGR